MRVPVATTYEDPRAHAVRERYLALFGGEGLPVPVEEIAEDLLGLRIEESWNIDCSGMLLPAERRIVLNANESVGGRNDLPLRRFRFTIAHEIGHWVCHCLEGRAPSPEPSYCRPVDLTDAADRILEREANVFAAELLMPESAVRDVWAEREDIAACASRFDVSPTAMHWRLHSFGLQFIGPAGSSNT
jgi:IrrE N-terminal-like domain